MTIEVIDERAQILAAGWFSTATAGSEQMLVAGRKHPDREWAFERCNGSPSTWHTVWSTVLDVPAKLSALVRRFAIGNARKTEPVDARSVALVALRPRSWYRFGLMPTWW